MNHRREAILNHPALIPIAGNFDRKPRSLDRDVTTIGRARGTDLCLEANEISTLHCIIYRSADGFRIRDCNSRTGTRINGESFKNQVLHDSDIINLGPFSFEFRIPPALFPRDATRLDPAKIEHWKRSRDKLARQALKLRQRLREADHGASAREAELEQKAHQIKEKIRAYDHRLRDMEEAEEELTAEREKLAQEHEAHRNHVQQMEGKLAQRLAHAEQEIHQRWQEFQLRCQADEVRLHKMIAAGSVPASAAAENPSEATPGVAELQQNLEAQQLKLLDLEERLTRQQQQLHSERQEFLTMKDQWVKDQTQTSGSLQEQQSALAQREAAVQSQKAELMRMMGSLKKMQEDLRKQAKGDVRALHEDKERLLNENAQLQAQLAGQETAGEMHAALEENDKLRARVSEFEAATHAAPAPELDDLRAEIDLLREELHNKEVEIEQLHQQPRTASSGAAVGEKVRAENELLQKLLQEKDRFLQELIEKAKHQPKNENDLERYETELNHHRRQLDTDRTKLNKEVEVLRERNKELDDAVREMEMEMSKERAELGRERMRLERVREEIKGDMERMQREIAVRDSMAPVQKLRDEIAAKQAGGAGKTEKALNDRLRGFRNQLSDKPS